LSRSFFYHPSFFDLWLPLWVARFFIPLNTNRPLLTKFGFWIAFHFYPLFVPFSSPFNFFLMRLLIFPSYQDPPSSLDLMPGFFLLGSVLSYLCFGFTFFWCPYGLTKNLARLFFFPFFGCPLLGCSFAGVSPYHFSLKFSAPLSYTHEQPHSRPVRRIFVEPALVS